MDKTIGFGIFVKRNFRAGDLLLEYKGEVMPRKTGNQLHIDYAASDIGCFIYDIEFHGKKLSIDATFSFSFGKFINDSPRRFSNCKGKLFEHEGQPHLMFVALKNIAEGEELRYDYGDTTNQMWRENKNYIKPFTLKDVENVYRGKVLRMFKSSSTSTSDQSGLAENTQNVNYLFKKLIGTIKKGTKDVCQAKDDQLDEVIGPSPIKRPKMMSVLNHRAEKMSPELECEFNNGNSIIVETDTLMEDLFENEETLFGSSNKQMSSIDVNPNHEDAPNFSFDDLPNSSEVVTRKSERRIFTCPVSWCKKEVKNLPQHLQSKLHNWSKDSARNSVGLFSLRKNLPSNDSVRKCCLFPSCMAVIKRLDDHLKKVHAVQSLVTIRQMTHNAMKFDEIPIADNNQGISPRKRSATNLEKKTKPSLGLSGEHQDGVSNDVAGDLDEEDFVLEDDRVTSHEDGSDIDFVIEELSNDVSTILEKFYKYLVGSNNLRSEDSSKRTVGDVKRILVAVGATDSFTTFFDVDSLSRNYIGCMKKQGLKAGSIKKYLFSAIDFCDFLIVNRELREELNLKKDIIEETKTSIIHWRKSFNKLDRKEFWVRQERDLESLITPEQVAKYLESDNSLAAIELFNFFKANF